MSPRTNEFPISLQDQLSDQNSDELNNTLSAPLELMETAETTWNRPILHQILLLRLIMDNLSNTLEEPEFEPDQQQTYITRILANLEQMYFDILWILSEFFV